MASKSENLREWRQRQREAGRCQYCVGGQAIPGRRYCAECRVYHNEYNKRRARVRNHMGLCRACDNPPKPGRVHCAECIAKVVDAARQKRLAIQQSEP